MVLPLLPLEWVLLVFSVLLLICWYKGELMVLEVDAEDEKLARHVLM